MKKLFTLIGFLGIVSLAYSQGTIVGFTLDPPNPATADNIKVYVDGSFSSGGCPLDNSGSSVSGNAIYAHAHHCLGMLSVICNQIDTFNIGNLSAGNYFFYMVLTTGAGGPGCTAGIVPDDLDTLHFTVNLPTAITEYDKLNAEVNIAPNPSQGIFQLTTKQQITTINIYNVLGECLLNQQLNNQQLNIDISAQPKGIYFVQLATANQQLITKKIIKQ